MILLDIYPARELPIDGITSENLLKEIDLKEKEVCSLSEGLERIKTKSFDVLVTAGAGDVSTLVQPIKTWLNED